VVFEEKPDEEEVNKTIKVMSKFYAFLKKT
jgi:hypothetical protein